MLYPEGDSVCHTLLLHPPGGIVGGDLLNIQLTLQSYSHVLITQPGATKWYRSNGFVAKQINYIKVDSKAVLEWLPQETIFYRGTNSNLNTVVELQSDSVFMGWDIYCFGRRSAKEIFDFGSVMSSYHLKINGQLKIFEKGLFEGGDPFMQSPIGMDNKSIFGTFIVYHQSLTKSLLDECLKNDAVEISANIGITLVDGILIARYLGDSSESVKNWFISLWKLLRLSLLGRNPVLPRIWRT